MLKKLPIRESGNEQCEFAERAARHSCAQLCRGCHDGDHYVADLVIEVTIDYVTIC